MLEARHGEKDKIFAIPASALYASPPLAAWLTYWTAFFPGIVMEDSLNQWRQLTVGHYDSVHPAFHTWVLGGVMRLWPSFGAVSLAQVVVATVLVGHVLAAVRCLGAPRWIVWGVVAWLTLSPVFGWSVIAVWKDSAFALAVLWVLAMLLRMARRQTMSAYDGAWLGVALALIWLFRHNGPAIVIPLIAVVAVRYRSVGSAGVGAAILVAAAIVVAVSSVAYRAAHVTPAPPWLGQQYRIHQVAALLSAATPLTDAERETLDPILPIDRWRAAYRCHSVVRLLFHSGMDLAAFDRRAATVRTIWARLAVRNPRALLSHWSCVTRFLRRPQSRLYIGPLSGAGEAVDPNPEGLHTTPLFQPARNLLTGIVLSTFTPGTLARALVWQPALSLYVFVASLAVATMRARSIAPLVFWLPGLCNTGVWLLLAQSPQLRFQWPLVLMTPVLCALAAADWRRIST